MAARRQTKAMLVLALTCFGVMAFSAHGRAQTEPEIRMLPPVAPQFETPPFMRLTGRLLPISEKERDGRPSFTLFIERKEWWFQLEEVETWNDATRSWTLLNDFLPSELHLIGSPDFLDPLQQPEMVNKRIVIQGRFASATQTLTVTAAAEEAHTSR